MSRVLIIRFLIQTYSDYLTTWFQVAWTITSSYNYPINLYSYIPIIPNLGLSIHCTPMLRHSDTPTLRFVRLRIRTTRLQWPKHKRLRVSSRIDPPSRGGKVRRCGHKRHTLQSKVDIPFPARATVLHRFIPTWVGCVSHQISGTKNWGSGIVWSLDWVTEVSRILGIRLSFTSVSQTRLSQFKEPWCRDSDNHSIFISRCWIIIASGIAIMWHMVNTIILYHVNVILGYWGDESSDKLFADLSGILKLSFLNIMHLIISLNLSAIRSPYLGRISCGVRFVVTMVKSCLS